MLSRSKVLLLLTLLTTLLHGQSPAIEWQYNYGGSQSDIGHSVATTSDGGYIVAAITDSDDGDVVGHQGQADLWVLKLTSDGTVLWQRCYGGSLLESGPAMVMGLPDGGYIIGCTSGSNDGDITCPVTGSMLWVLKINSIGEIEWQRCLGGSGGDVFRSVRLTPDGGYIVVGGTYSSDGDATTNNGLMDVLLIKLDEQGATQWSRCYGGSDLDHGRDVTPTMDGGYLVCGTTRSNDGDINGLNPYFAEPSSPLTGWILKVDSIGNIQWQQCVGGTGNDVLNRIFESDDGSIRSVGYTFSMDGHVQDNIGQDDGWLVKLASDGAFLSQKSLGGTQSDQITGGRSLYNNSLLLVGRTYSSDGDITAPLGAGDVWVMLVDEDLELLWSGNYGGSLNDLGTDIQVTPDGGAIVVGYSVSSDGHLTGNNGYIDLWVVKLEPWDDAGLHENPLQNALELFPNPATDLLHVQWAQWISNPMSWSIFDLTGREVAHGQAMGERSVIPLEDLATGTYLFQLRDGQGYQVKRFVKQ
jgi:hypothetical protein